MLAWQIIDSACGIAVSMVIISVVAVPSAFMLKVAWWIITFNKER